MIESMLLREALYFGSRGFSIIPLCWPGHPSGLHGGHSCEPHKQGKVNLVGWKKWQMCRATEDDIRAWWEEWPRANIGAVMGTVSGIVGWDADGPEGIKRLADLSGDEGWKTWTFKTGGGGLRFLFRLPVDCPISPRHFDTGSEKLTFLGEGSYTVLPPSRHSSGQSYAWMGEMRPGYLPVADMPEALCVALMKRRTPDREPVGGEGRPQTMGARIHYAVTKARGIGLCKRWQPAVTGQGGRVVAFHLACALIHGLGLREEDALQIMMRHWNDRCSPPWEEWELHGRVHSALTTGHYTPIPEKKLG